MDVTGVAALCVLDMCAINVCVTSNRQFACVLISHRACQEIVCVHVRHGPAECWVRIALWWGRRKVTPICSCTESGSGILKTDKEMRETGSS